MMVKQLLVGFLLGAGALAVPQHWVPPSDQNPRPPPVPSGGPRPPSITRTKLTATATSSSLATTRPTSTTSVAPTNRSSSSGSTSSFGSISTQSTSIITVSTRTTVTTTTTTSSTRSASTPSPTAWGSNATYTGNPFSGVKLFVNPHYRDEIRTYAIPQLSKSLAKQAAKVAEVPTFAWLDTRSKLSLMESNLRAIRKLNQRNHSQSPTAAQFVIYNFPDRDCSASASAGELSIANNGTSLYKSDYIDPIAKLAQQYSDVRIIFVFEPDGLASLITNLGVAKCANAADAIKEVTIYAWQKLNLPNVAIYVDAGHAGWLGWEANLQPTASLYASLYKQAGTPRAVRGLVTNVSNYNGYGVSSAPNFTSPDPNYDESRFHAALTPYLTAQGFPANFIVDLGRAGAQPGGRIDWGHWCNIKNSGFGPRPTEGGDTGQDGLDAVVWVKPGGESDGTSDSTVARFDSICVSASALTPAPEAGTWFQAYFEMLLRNANPSFA